MIRIDKGHFGDVDLSGLNVAMLYAWPGPVFEDKGEVQVVIEERVDEKQRRAVETVMHGKETEEAAALDLKDSYGQFNVLRHSGTGVVKT